jgi:hypothetical protein
MAKANINESPEPSTAEGGGGQVWVSHPQPEDTFNIQAGEHLKKQGCLPARTSLSKEDGTMTTYSVGTSKKA